MANLEQMMRLWQDRKWADTVALVQRLAGEAQNAMRLNRPWQDRTSAARAGLTAETRVEMAARRIVLTLRHGVEYGVYLERGSRPHPLAPRNAKALYWRGAEHPVKRVQHPGVRAGKYAIVLPTARRMAEEELPRRLRQLWRGW